MTISAEVLEDSINERGERLTTFILKYPRFIHAELMTHRYFSRNTASSRAIPSRKIRAMVLNDMAWPIFWGKNQAGMQAAVELTGPRLWLIQSIWILAGYSMVAVSWILGTLNLHKQLANRILEPWLMHTALVSATEWDNFYALRDHKDAQPEIRELAKRMLAAHGSSTPKLLKDGDWHLPFVTAEERKCLSLDAQVHVSVARSARISYMTHEGRVSSLADDLKMYDRLLASTPRHASPAEHQATPAEGWHGNFKGWKQHRKFITDEAITHYQPYRDGFSR